MNQSATFTKQMHVDGRFPQSEVDLEPIRVAFLESGLTYSEVARRLDWWRINAGRRRPDASRVARGLGLSSYHGDHHGNKITRKRCSSYRAWELLDAMGLDPKGFGL